MTPATKSLVGGNDRQLSVIEEAIALEAEAREELERIFQGLRDEATHEHLHQVELRVFRAVMGLGLTLVQAFLAQKGSGYVGPRLEQPEGVWRYHGQKTRSYLSVFGPLKIPRAYYRGEEAPGVFPLDAQLNLPREKYSQLLQQWAQLFAVDGSFQGASDRLERLLGVRFWTQGLQRSVRKTAQDTQAFYEAQAPRQDTEGEILVASVDGKGVPMRRTEPRPRKARLSAGDKANKKKEAVVTAVYTMAPHVRTPDDVVREIDGAGNKLAPEHELPKRPRPQNKRLRAFLGRVRLPAETSEQRRVGTGKEVAFKELRRQLEERDPGHEKPWVLLLDGDKNLHFHASERITKGTNTTIVLDLMHVLDYVWEASYAMYETGSAEAARWVMRKLRLLLEGKVGYVIGDLKSWLSCYELSATGRKAVETAVRYMTRFRHCMHYDDYIARGFPISSGVVEGACRHLVKDRMEQAGMHWDRDGAQAVLNLRSVELNGNWDAFWEFRNQAEQRRIYGTKAVSDELSSCGQAA